MATAVAAASSHLLHHHFLHPPPRPPQFLSRLLISTTRRHFSFLSVALSPPIPLADTFSDLADESNEEVKEEVKVRVSLPVRNVPMLSTKEKKELGSYARSLGDKLKSQQVGKSGVTANSVMAFGETLERNELLKLKIHGTCPAELDEVVDQLEKATGSVAVGRIGRTVILYRPSLTKLKDAQNKKPPRKFIVKKPPRTSKPPSMERGARSRNSNRGRRGSTLQGRDAPLFLGFLVADRIQHAAQWNMACQ
ncbi:hypothetical protein Droror1_Dr00005888 [Drosera rotundifolia]